MRILAGLLFFVFIISVASCDQLKNAVMGDDGTKNDLAKAVQAKLDSDELLAAAGVVASADPKTGEVTLRGEVSLPELIQKAEELAKSVPGVKSVVNRVIMQEQDSGMLQEPVNTPAGQALGF
ncbi:MAG: BON domain-containing protein [bacterium]|jgi:osmotically-inducible protein OsmY